MSTDRFAFSSAPSPEELARFDRNDYGNGLRLIRLAGGVVTPEGVVDASASRLLYLHGTGWVGFNGQFWDRVFGDDLARRMAHAVAREVRGLFAHWAGDEPSATLTKEIMRFMDGCGSAGATSAMLRQAQVYLTVEIDVFDRNPLALNCRNGTLKLRVEDGRLVRDLRPHDPSDRITRMAAVDYDRAATAPLFRQVHLDSFPVLEEGEYFQRTCGYGSTGLTREQAFFINQGKGRDGKSTLLDGVRKALGTYAEAGDVLTFLEGGIANGSGPSPDLARLAGDVRFVVLSEPKRGAAWNESRLKAWTSGSPIPARDLNAKTFTFKPVGKLFVECNPFPKPRGDDDGFWRRIKPVLFRRQVPIADIDQLLPDKIEAAELPGVLNWLLDGMEDWLCGPGGRSALRAPASLDRVVEDYRRQSSPFGDWLAEETLFGDQVSPSTYTMASDLYRAFKDWCEAQQIDKPMSQRSFGDAMTDRQIMRLGKDGKGNVKRGPIRLKTLDEREQDAAEYTRAAEEATAAPSTAAANGPTAWRGVPSAAADFDADGDDPFGAGGGSEGLS